jgi:hypothetical protein
MERINFGADINTAIIGTVKLIEMRALISERSVLEAEEWGINMYALLVTKPPAKRLIINTM